jgi:predicted nucleic acid-binding protein
MKLQDGLRGITLVGLDTAPVIYFVEANPKYEPLVSVIFQQFSTGTLRGVTSAVTLGEVLVKPLAANDARLVTLYRNVLLRTRNLDTIAITLTAAESAASLRARHRMLLPDSLQIATTLEAGCQAFLTNDVRLKRVTELRVLVLDELEL